LPPLRCRQARPRGRGPDGNPDLRPERPVEILRTVHSFDPCIACGVHVLDAKTGKTASFKVL
jgi:[NiFe] hydrogenase large subunit